MPRPKFKYCYTNQTTAEMKLIQNRVLRAAAERLPGAHFFADEDRYHLMEELRLQARQ